jgi:hypothetical protein
MTKGQRLNSYKKYTQRNFSKLYIFLCVTIFIYAFPLNLHILLIFHAVKPPYILYIIFTLQGENVLHRDNRAYSPRVGPHNKADDYGGKIHPACPPAHFIFSKKIPIVTRQTSYGGNYR